MELYEYYVLSEDNKPRKVSRIFWEAWMRSTDLRRICVAETHLIYRGEPATVVTTRFTGVDTAPYGLCDPYLWETKVVYSGETWRHSSYEAAAKAHEQRVRDTILTLRKDNFIVTRRDINIQGIREQ
jgi:hypothetical protein